MAAPPTELTLRLQAAPEYLIGLPFFVEITLTNETEGADYYGLLSCDPLSPPFPVEFTFTAGTASVTLPAQSSMRGEARPGFDLEPGQSRTFVLDLSELEPALDPGMWRCQACWVMRHEHPRSAPVPVGVGAPDPADLPLLELLRRAGGSQTASWANFLKSPAVREQEEVIRKLSQRARLAMLPYLIMHQAVQGPESLAEFSPEFLTAHEQGPWASEASVLVYELLWTRSSVDLPRVRATLLQRWPGLAFRVEQIEADAGLLTTLRRNHGPSEGRT